MNEELLQKVVDLAMALGKGGTVHLQVNCCWQSDHEGKTRWLLASPAHKNRYFACLRISDDGRAYGPRGIGTTQDEALSDLYKQLEKSAVETISKILEVDPDIL